MDLLGGGVGVAVAVAVVVAVVVVMVVVVMVVVVVVVVVVTVAVVASVLTLTPSAKPRTWHTPKALCSSTASPWTDAWTCTDKAVKPVSLQFLMTV